MWASIFHNTGNPANLSGINGVQPSPQGNGCVAGAAPEHGGIAPDAGTVGVNEGGIKGRGIRYPPRVGRRDGAAQGTKLSRDSKLLIGQKAIAAKPPSSSSIAPKHPLQRSMTQGATQPRHRQAYQPPNLASIDAERLRFSVSKSSGQCKHCTLSATLASFGISFWMFGGQATSPAVATSNSEHKTHWRLPGT